MKKVISVLLVLMFVLSTAITVFAAEAKKYSDCTTNAQKIAWLKDTYGITHLGEWRIDLVGETGKAMEATMLDRVYTAWSMVGQSSTQKIFNHYLNGSVSPKFQVDFIDKPLGGSGSTATGDSRLIMNFDANLWTGTMAPTVIVVHETMHALDMGSINFAGASTVAAINGAYSGYTNGNQYVTQYAATEDREDFAETTAYMIYNGGDAPCTVGKDTILYKKYKACYDLLLDSFGEKSNAVKRSAAFLGIELPKE